MKILPRTLLIAGCGVSLVSLAHAQSSALTLWGQVDSGITYISNKRGGSSWGTASGIGSPTRWGLRGNEDLGGGYRAVFALESGFNVNTGALIKTNTLFDRQAYVGLDGPLGTLTLGRQSDLMDDVAIRYSNAFWNRSLYSFHAGNLDSLTNGYQIENAVKYRSPDWYGVRVGALYGFAGSDASGHSAGAYATYDRGPLSAGVTYMTTKRRVLDLYNYFGWTRFLGQTLSAQQTFQSNAVDNLGIGLTYRIVQPWTINVLYTRTDIKGARSATHMQNIDAGTLYQFTAAEAITLDYTYSRMEGMHWNTLEAGNLYSLSKRTQVQATLTWQLASGNGATAATYPNGPSSGRSQVLAHVGITHSF
ncbi:porin [Burkholderia multivorans]|uniref:porin n=1 Tax=Burkholderia multivorans TaxID=87883 RepID=UPI000D35525F|nr:porin [Burkholderia multivorans]MBR8022091.1 porin [Burkholderia multivorans]MDN7609691.1 porin [Burkholderia multivorans]MEB2512339.1 porin [Burkholderia multivorans]MEB2523431.1 porin [Burkholderia multivorans]MEB2575119.1 porin [Burkholderia multivorans]